MYSSVYLLDLWLSPYTKSRSTSGLKRAFWEHLGNSLDLKYRFVGHPTPMAGVSIFSASFLIRNQCFLELEGSSAVTVGTYKRTQVR